MWNDIFKLFVFPTKRRENKKGRMGQEEKKNLREDEHYERFALNWSILLSLDYALLR